jgi:hypothetical protein
MNTFALALILSVAATGAGGDERKPAPKPGSSPNPGPSGTSWERASSAKISRLQASGPVAAAVPRPADSRVAGEAGGLQGAKAVALEEGEATLLVGGAPLHLRPGSPVGADIVKSIGSDRIVLVRGATPMNPTGAATVVLTFDAQGQSRVRVYRLSDPAAATPREVR